jgi:methionyl-tRNA formyltransferase
MINAVLCGYRDWAFKIFDSISSHPKLNIVQIFKSNQQFLENIKSIDSNSIDFILFIGWSWILDKDITNKYHCLGIHPSDLPLFRGGSPLQHQIIQGVKKSKVSLITLADDKIDAGEIWLKEDLDLAGDTMDQIFENLVSSTVKLLFNFLDNYHQIKPIPQRTEEGTYFKRRKPEESRMERVDFQNKSLEEIYNFIRCLTDPYPNAFLEDEFGNKLVFKKVVYIPKNSE